MKKILYLLLFTLYSLVTYSQTTPLPSGSTARASQAYTKNDSVYFQLGPYGSVRLPVYQDVQYKAVQTLVQRNAIPASFRKKGMLVWVTDSVKHFVLSAGITNSDWIPLSTTVDLSGYAKLVGGNTYAGYQLFGDNIGVDGDAIISGNILANSFQATGEINTTQNVYADGDIGSNSNINAAGTITGSNLSGTNTGDETTATIKTKLGVSTNSLDGYLTAADHTTFNAKQNGVTLTTTGTSGASTFNPTTGALNIPSYAAGTGTVTSVSVTSANGVSGTVATSTTTPVITLSLGAITPTSTNGVSAATMAFLDPTSSIQAQLNGKGSGIKYVFTSSTPSDTTVSWVDTGHEVRKAYPIRNRINGAWQPITDDLQYYDRINSQISYGKPITILFSGQSNVAVALYFPADNPTYTGDTTTNTAVTYWDGSSSLFKVYRKSTALSPFDEAQSKGANNIVTFAKLLNKDTRRSIRLVGTRASGIALSAWSSVDSVQYIALKAAAVNSGVDNFDTFIWVHGEAGLGTTPDATTYRQGYYNLVTRLRAESFIAAKTKFISTSHGLGHETPLVDPITAEGTARGLDIDTDQYTGWAPIPSPKEAKFGFVDGYHFTTREHEKMGASIFNTFKNLPYLSMSKRSDYTFSYYTGINLRSLKIPRLMADTIRNMYSSNNASGNTGLFSQEFGFSASGIPTAKFLAKPQGGSNRGEFEFWNNNTGIEASSSDKILNISPTGVSSFKPSIAAQLGVTTGVNNSGDATLNFYNDGTISSTTTLGKTVIASRSLGSFGRGDLHFVFGPTSGATPVVGTNTAVIFKASGVVGIGTTSPTAILHIKAGTATANTAPLKFTSGVNLTTPEAGAMEFDGTNFYLSPSTTRKRIPLTDNVTPSNGQIPIGNGTDYTVAALTAGSGISITNGSGSITVATTTLSGSATLDFPSTNSTESSILTITVSGAAIGDVVALGSVSEMPNSSYTAYVDATNTVTVKFNNYGALSRDPASGTFTVKVFK